YEIAYTFGASPLQQYLIKFPGGRYQVLSIGWDSRPGEDGGQRWVHLYPDEKIPHDDELHWTGPNQNWNYMCANCHSTNLRQNYRLDQDLYETVWSEIDVSCEACHGPGSRHVDWARMNALGQDRAGEGHKGLEVHLSDPDHVTWLPDVNTGTAKRSSPRLSRAQVETCARCHSRRRVIDDDDVYGRPLLDTHRPSLLDAGLYHADGQILGEVYVYGSFLQSKMYRAGVTCSDCHEPHGLDVHAPGNALCTRCHEQTRFDTPKHHFHKPKSPGAMCVDCHMPERTYMVVDPRRDHSFRIPRPDLTEQIGTPNACTQCHTNRSARWAAEMVARWYGHERPEERDYGPTLQAGRDGVPEGGDALVKLAGDTNRPSIVRATALDLLDRFPNQTTIGAIEQGLEDSDPLVRVAALGALQVVEPAHRYEMAQALLSDPIRAVRIEAARSLALAPRHNLTSEQQAVLERATNEYIEAELVSAERPSAHLNLGIFYTERGQLEDAEAAYQTALRLDPSFYPALANLADLYRLEQRDAEGEAVLRRAVKLAPDEANVHHSLGLLLVRSGRHQEAVASFARAAELQPDDPQHDYVYGLALHAVDETDQAIMVLEGAHRRHPKDGQILLALATISRDTGAFKAAIHYAEQLVALSPQDQAAQQLLQQLRAGRRR
ncbi:MAG: tetratricopeptide repeat protein, partial [Nitrospiraceae bacterium]